MAAVLPIGTSKADKVEPCSCKECECDIAREWKLDDDDRQSRCARYIARTKTVFVKECKHCPSSNAERMISCHTKDGCLSKRDCERQAMLKRRRY